MRVLLTSAGLETVESLVYTDGGTGPRFFGWTGNNWRIGKKVLCFKDLIVLQ